MAHSVSGCATLDTTLVDAPKAPVYRRVLIGLLLALTVLLHVTSAGWGPIRNGAEGIAAATARSMTERADGWLHPTFAGQRIVPEDWLTAWLTAASFRALGPTEFAARLPQALAVLLIVWWVFLIAERLGGTWRGIAAGLIATTCVGIFPFGNAAGNGAMWAAMVTGALYFLLRCLEQVPQRKPFVIRFWIFMALSVLAADWSRLLCPVLIVAVLLSRFRTARIRLAALPKNWGIGVFCVAIALRFWLGTGWGGENSSALPSGVYWYLFPWTAVVVMPFLLRWKKVLRISDMEPADALPWLWALFSGPATWLLLWPAFALCAAIIWERVTSGMRLAGVALLLLTTGVAFFAMPHFVSKEVADSLWPTWWLSCGAVAAFGLVAFAFTLMRQSRAALLAVSAAVIPFGFNLLDAQKHVTEKTSGRSLAENFLPGTHQDDVLYTDEKPETISGFLFYWRGAVKKTSGPFEADRGAFTLYRNDGLYREGAPVAQNKAHVLLALHEPARK